MVRIRFQVTGDVQGVGFRAFSRERACGRGLSGWVRNRRDGAVEGEVEGPSGSLEAFLGELRRGPVSSQVDSLSSHEVPSLGDAPPFRIEH